MVSKLDNQRRMNMKRNLNKTFAYIWVMMLVMMGGPAFGQRDNGGGNGGNATTQHVEVRGNVYGGGNLAPVAGNTSVLVERSISWMASSTVMFMAADWANWFRRLTPSLPKSMARCM